MQPVAGRILIAQLVPELIAIRGFNLQRIGLVQTIAVAGLVLVLVGIAEAIARLQLVRGVAITPIEPRATSK